MANWVIEELQRNSTKWDKVVEEIVRIEKKIFPKHESLARTFDEELKKKNSGLLFSHVEEDGDVAGYVMYSWPSSLSASITKLAGSSIFCLPPFLLLLLLCFCLFLLFDYNFRDKIEIERAELKMIVSRKRNQNGTWDFITFSFFWI